MYQYKGKNNLREKIYIMVIKRCLVRIALNRALTNSGFKKNVYVYLVVKEDKDKNKDGDEPKKIILSSFYNQYLFVIWHKLIEKENLSNLIVSIVLIEKLSDEDIDSLNRRCCSYLQYLDCKCTENNYNNNFNESGKTINIPSEFNHNTL